MKLLIADDDLTTRSMLAAVCRKWGYEPVLAESGDHAWEIIQREDSPRLLLLDWEMPAVSGPELCRRIRQRNNDDPPYIILLTVRDSTRDIVTGLDAGANEYISKPFEHAELRARLDAGRRILDMQRRHLRSEERLLLAANVFDHACEGIVITTPDATILEVNRAFSRITGYAREEVIGKTPRILKSDRQDASFYEQMWDQLLEKGHWSGEIWNRHKNGQIYPEFLTISAVHDNQGKTRHYVALFSDISTLKEQQHRLEHLAHYDALTGLPNRVLLAEHLQHAMYQSHRDKRRLVVAYLDLDGFKEINDTHGHDIGDRLLMNVAQNMKESLRESDIIARLGGDEFVAVLSSLGDAETATPLLKRLLAAASQPIRVGPHRLQVSASIGITLFPQSEDVGPDQLLRQADQAMYQAKLEGRNRLHFFDPEQDRNIRGHHESLEHISRAMERQEFVLHYQPKVNMRSGELRGVEALIRWNHEEGLLTPDHFLPVVENHRLGIRLGEGVIDTALCQLERWQAEGLHTSVSVNLSALQLQQHDFTRRLTELLARHPEVSPETLILEVLETSALEDIAHVSQVIRECTEMGVQFALDDFGTGYSSLTYLKRLPAAELKIDRSFVRDMLHDADDLAILEGVVGMATAFRRRVVAEGVESTEHGELLLQIGCELGQGYGIARPMPAEKLIPWMESWQPDPRWTRACTVPREELPLIFAGIEHSHWIHNLRRQLEERHARIAVEDHHQCRFGQWFDREGRSRYGDHPAYPRIDAIHREVHRLAHDLARLHREGENVGIKAGIARLFELKDRLLATLASLKSEA